MGVFAQLTLDDTGTICRASIHPQTVHKVWHSASSRDQMQLTMQNTPDRLSKHKPNLMPTVFGGPHGRDKCLH